MYEVPITTPCGIEARSLLALRGLEAGIPAHLSFQGSLSAVIIGSDLLPTGQVAWNDRGEEAGGFPPLNDNRAPNTASSCFLSLLGASLFCVPSHHMYRELTSYVAALWKVQIYDDNKKQFTNHKIHNPAYYDCILWCCKQGFKLFLVPLYGVYFFKCHQQFQCIWSNFGVLSYIIYL